MLLLLALACLACPLAAGLPDVTVSHDGGLKFKMPHVQGAEQVFINYLIQTAENKLLPKVGKAMLGGDGQWVWRDLKTILQPGDKVQYNADVYRPEGKLQTPLQDWLHTPPMTSMGPRRTRAVIFREDFNAPSVNRANWDYEVSMYGGMNWEFQVYVPDESNVFTRGGNLYLKPTLTELDPRFGGDFLHTGVMDMQQIWGQCTNSARYGCHREGKDGLLPPIMSGKITSKATFKYGTVEVRARIPRGDWIWPAIWFLPRNNVYGGWPRSGEIDLMESRGNFPDGVSQTLSTLHWGSSYLDNHFQQTADLKQATNWGTDFHIWKLEWTPDHIICYVDNEPVLRVNPPSGGFKEMGPVPSMNWDSKMAPFDQDFYLILNVAVGGTNGFFPDGRWSNKPWRNDAQSALADFYAAKNQWYSTWHGDDAAMMVDWVEFRSL